MIQNRTNRFLHRINLKNHTLILYFIYLIFLSLVVNNASLFAYPVTVIDSKAHKYSLSETPKRVVSLVPAVTEIIFQLGAGKSVKGVTYHDAIPEGEGEKTIVGGFFSPPLDIIESIKPDVIFVSSLHHDVYKHFSSKKCSVIAIDSNSIDDLYKNIRLLGLIFNKEQVAEKIVGNINNEVKFISQKIDKIPEIQREKVIRLMGVGQSSLTTPGDDSFQNDFIRAAGGIPPMFGKNGNIVEITMEEWKQFNPQIIYGCGNDREAAQKFFEQPGWEDVDAVRSNRIFYFPCDLTCRASVHTGEFIEWLASRIYEEEFASPKNWIHKQNVVQAKPIEISLDYISFAKIMETTVFDFLNKTLVIEFKKPMKIISTLEGTRDKITAVGNHYSPPPCWGITHRLGLEAAGNSIYKALGKSKKNTSLLFTGADMDNLSVQKVQFKDMTVYALVTAGVESNAVRMSEDKGNFYEPGTINIILMTNMKLSKRAMARAIISATEAKTAAMEDLDIRSSATPLKNQATGTGTDEIIVVEGAGVPIDNAGGHSKMGELIAKAVYDGVTEAVFRQNGLKANRNIFHRLKERNITIYGLIANETCDCGRTRNEMVRAVEEILLDPRYAGFMEASFALSDDYEKGLFTNLDSYNAWARNITEEIADCPVENIKEIADTKAIPAVLGTALNAILNGVYYRKD